MKKIDFSCLEFAEICGIHAGDGWLSSSINEIGFGTSNKEKQYFEYVKTLYSEFFKISIPRVLNRSKYNLLEFRIQSKKIQSCFLDAGFVRGPKLDSLRVPEFIFKDQECMKLFLKGLMDTDGSVYWRKSGKYYYLIICFNTSSEFFGKEILSLLKQLGYNPQFHIIKAKNSIQGNKRRPYVRVTIQKIDEVFKYINSIGFCNRTKNNQVEKRGREFRKRYEPARI